MELTTLEYVTMTREIAVSFLRKMRKSFSARTVTGIPELICAVAPKLTWNIVCIAMVIFPNLL